MFNNLLQCEETNVSISQVEEYAKEITRNLKDTLTPQHALCLTFIEGMFHENELKARIGNEELPKAKIEKRKLKSEN